MNIEAQDEVKYVGSIRRSSALSIDMIIVMFLRIFVAQVLGALWINNLAQQFMKDFAEYFGTETIKNTPEHIAFITSHPAFSSIVIFYFIIIGIGLFYHAYLNSSNWQATIGKRLLNIQVVKKDDHKKIGFMLAIGHYLLSILPVIFVIYLMTIVINNHLTLFSAITSSSNVMFVGILSVLWVQIHAFTKNKTTAYDIICNLVYIQNKSSAKLPWNKI